jgi:hypothetical protein
MFIIEITRVNASEKDADAQMHEKCRFFTNSYIIIISKEETAKSRKQSEYHDSCTTPT